MGTYDHKQVISDYVNDKITPEMAIGHSLQHIRYFQDLNHPNKFGSCEA